MPNTRVQVTLKTVDAIPANYITNSYCVHTASGSPDTDGLTTAFKDFYDDLSGILSVVIAQNGHGIKYSDLPGTPPNYPFEEDVFNLASAPVTPTQPTEVAIGLSFQGVRAAGFPQARRRGRVFIGPVGTGSNTLGRPSAGVQSQIATAAATLKASIALLGPSAHAWAIWSHADQTNVNIDNGWVDNAFDTQRRRGVVPTSRTTFI